MKGSLGWSEKPKDDPEVIQFREHLAQNNGIKGLEIVSGDDVAGVVRRFRRDGFVLVGDVLTPDQIDFLATGCREVVDEIVALDADRKGNRGSQRYSFGGSSLTRSQLHRPEWQMMLEVPLVDQLVTAIFGSADYVLRAASGDFCLPGTLDYQRLHSDVRDWVSDKESPFSAFHDPTGEVTN